MGLLRSRKAKIILISLALGMTMCLTLGCGKSTSHGFEPNPEAVFHTNAKVDKTLEEHTLDKDYVYNIADKFKGTYKDVMDNLPPGIKQLVLKSNLKVATGDDMSNVDYRFLPKYNVIFINEDASDFRENLCKGLGDYLVSTNFCGKLSDDEMDKEMDNCYDKDVPSHKHNSDLMNALLPAGHLSDCIAEYLNLGSKEIEKTNPTTYKFLEQVMETNGN